MDDLETFLDSIPVGHRKKRFHDLAAGMISAGRPISILETGCMRELSETDGCSTLVWDYVAEVTKGGFVTVDISEHNTAFARSKVGKHTQVVCKESLALLSAITYMHQPIDLLYLDSLDYVGTDLELGLSSLHHAAELSAVWRWLGHEALIAVDDCIDAEHGKHSMVRAFFHSLGVEPIVDDYIHVWRKPSPRPITL
jgi:hypothetical protein